MLWGQGNEINQRMLDPRPKIGSPALDPANAAPAADYNGDTWFDVTDYVGAFDNAEDLNSYWIYKWTALDKADIDPYLTVSPGLGTVIHRGGWATTPLIIHVKVPNFEIKPGYNVYLNGADRSAAFSSILANDGFQGDLAGGGRMYFLPIDGRDLGPSGSYELSFEFPVGPRGTTTVAGTLSGKTRVVVP
ncbi:MAG: hypothetical protein GF363_11980 [Chitinivibrionales bacterium]|nr:hypothetical protein [Chitinivibrionales bacterium]